LKLHPNHFVGSAGRLDSADTDCVDSDLVESEIYSNDPVPIPGYLPDHPAVKIALRLPATQCLLGQYFHDITQIRHALYPVCIIVTEYGLSSYCLGRIVLIFAIKQA